MPETICPMPKAHTWESVWVKYKEMQKKYPGLTAAAHRKAAAQELGLDYDTFLKLWKMKPKGAKIPLSVPTAPAADAEIDYLGMAPSPKVKVTAGASKKAAAAKPSGPSIFASDAMKQINVWEKEFINAGQTSSAKDELIAKLNQLNADPGLAASGKNITTHYLKKYGESVATEEAKLAAEVAEEAAQYAQTHLGPLTHDLAQSVFKKMKAEMPGATPAQLRHAAADYLKVDYDTYLKAWKKPTTAKAAAKTAKTLPPNTSAPLVDDPTGFWANKLPTADDLKTELAKLYGPGANKAFIDVQYSPAKGYYYIKFPQSLLPTKAAKDGVVKGLKDIGLDVDGPNLSGGYKISTKALKKHVEGVQGTSTGLVTADVGEAVIQNATGHAVWNTKHADAWAREWWQQLTAREQQAVRGYTGSGYRALNKWLRGEGPMPSGGSNTSSALSSALAKKPMPEGVTVFRGSPHPPITSFRPGSVFQPGQFMSTAAHKGSSWSGVKYEITTGPGVRGAYVDPHSSHQGELEVILDKNTKYRILSVDPMTNVVKMLAYA